MTVLGALLLVTSVLTEAVPQAPVAGERVVVGLLGSPQIPSPVLAETEGDLFMTYLLARPVVVRTDTGEFVCALCSELPELPEISETDANRNEETVTLNLSPSARWGNGKQISAADVVLGWRCGIRVTTSETVIYDLGAIKTITPDAKDPFKLSISWTGSERALAIALTRVFPLPAEDEKPCDDKTTRGSYSANTVYAHQTAPGLFNGPFVISSHVGEREIGLSANKHFHVPVGLASLGVKYFKNPETLRERVESGEITLVTDAASSVAADLLASIRQSQLGLGLTWKSVPGPYLEQVSLNLRNPLMHDIQVRRALALAVDPRLMPRDLDQKLLYFPSGVFHPYDSSLPKIVAPFANGNPEESLALLSKAGWEKAPDGFLYREEIPLEVEISVAALDQVRLKLAEYLKASWEKIGIKVSVKEVASASLGQTLRRARFHTGALYAWETAFGESLAALLHSDEIPDSGNGYSGSNVSAFASREVDDILASAGDKQLSPQSALALSHILKDEVPVIPLARRARFVLAPRNLEGVTVYPHEAPASLSAAAWKISEPGKR